MIVIFCFIAHASQVAAQVTTTSLVDSATDQHGILLITSDPVGASIVLDSAYVGVTPKLFPKLRATMHHVSVNRPGYLPFQCYITIIPNDTLAISAHLVSSSALATIMANKETAVISIDGQERGTGRVDSISLLLGKHTITTVDPSGRVIQGAFKIDQGEHVSIVADYDVFSPFRLFAGILLPGLLQLNDANLVEGAAFSLAGAGSIVYFASSSSKYSVAEQDYRLALDAYDRASTEPEAQQLRNIADRRYDEFSVAKRRLRLSVGALAAVWIGNAVELVLNHLLTDRIEVIAHQSIQRGPANEHVSNYYLSFGVHLR